MVLKETGRLLSLTRRVAPSSSCWNVPGIQSREPLWAKVGYAFLRLDELAPTRWQSLGGLKEFMRWRPPA